MLSNALSELKGETGGCLRLAILRRLAALTEELLKPANELADHRAAALLHSPEATNEVRSRVHRAGGIRQLKKQAAAAVEHHRLVQFTALRVSPSLSIRQCFLE